MKLIDDLLATLPSGPVREVCIGAFWTAVVAEVDGQVRCGLASTLRDSGDRHHGEGPAMPQAGSLHRHDARTLASLARSRRPLEAAVGMATINALLPRQPEHWVERNAAEVIAQHGAEKAVVVVGHFPFVEQLRARVGGLAVLEQHPSGADLPATAAPEIIPQAEVIAITGATLLNHTFRSLMALCRPEALVLVLGPSTPLSPVLFDYGVDLISSAVVEDVPAVLQVVSQGGNFRQVHRHGVRLVTMTKEI